MRYVDLDGVNTNQLPPWMLTPSMAPMAFQSINLIKKVITYALHQHAVTSFIDFDNIRVECLFYPPKVGLRLHTDDPMNFNGPSLVYAVAGNANVEWVPYTELTAAKPVTLPLRESNITIMTNESRYLWSHGIPENQLYHSSEFNLNPHGRYALNIRFVDNFCVFQSMSELYHRYQMPARPTRGGLSLVRPVSDNKTTCPDDLHLHQPRSPDYSMMAFAPITQQSPNSIYVPPSKFQQREVCVTIGDAKIKLPDPYQKLHGYRPLHWGQRKLALMELYFLSRCSLPDVSVDIVYAGASNGLHLVFLFDEFTKANWYLYGIDPFHPLVHQAAVNNPRIHLYEGETHGYFCVDVCNRITTTRSLQQQTTMQPRRPLLFISDARTSIGADPTNAHERYDQRVRMDMKDQLRWAKQLQPDFSLLKFRLPCHCPRHSNVPLTCYPPGDLFLFPWSPGPSTELRLLCSKLQLQESVVYDSKSVLAKVDYHHLFLRSHETSKLTWGYFKHNHSWQRDPHLNDLKSPRCNDRAVSGEPSISGIAKLVRLKEFWMHSDLPFIGWDAAAEVFIWVYFHLHHRASIPITLSMVRSRINVLTMYLDGNQLPDTPGFVAKLVVTRNRSHTHHL
jgi:hypothetical protein